MKNSIMIVLCLAACMLCSCSSNTPSKVVKGYFEALAAKDHVKAVSYFANLTEEEKYAKEKQLKEFFSTAGIANNSEVKVTILLEEIAEDGETVKMEVRVKTIVEGKTIEDVKMACPLVKVDGKWMIPSN